MTFRKTAVLFSALSVFLIAQPARADLLQFLFPSVFGQPEKGPKAEDTLVAPFAQNKSGPTRTLSEQEQKILAAPENGMPLGQPHRSDKYIQEWATEHVAGALKFRASEIDKHMQNLNTVFTPTATADFQTYLTSTNLLSSMQADGQKMESFVNDISVIKNSGNFGGVYRWLIDVPVDVTLMPQALDNYQHKVLAAAVTTRKLTVRVQIGRAAAPFPDGVAIEHFTVLPQP